MNEADFQRSQILSQMFGLLAVLKQQFEVPVSAELKGTFDRERLRKVLIYVQEHFSEDISIQDVADQVLFRMSIIWTRIFPTGIAYAK